MTDIEDALRNPVSWAIGGVSSVATVLLTAGGDPISTAAAIMNVSLAHATEAFTAASIAGFTIAPELDWLPEGSLSALAMVFGVLVVIKMVSRLWSSLMRRLREV